jgi:hypothetical protein
MRVRAGELDSRSTRGDHLRFGLLCVLGYVALSWSVRFDMPRGEQIASLIYPLDTFSMYAGVPHELMSIFLIRDEQGAVHHVTDFHSFSCEEPVSGSEATCGESPWIQYLHDDLTHYVEAHAGPGELDVVLIARTWQMRPGASPVHTADCVIAHCKVSR